MTAELKPYPTMKDSGVEWLGMVPEHWEIRRAKYLFNSIDVRSENGDEELLTVSSRDGVVPRSEKTVTMFQAASYAGHKLCWPGDLVINSLWAWANGLGFSRYHGIVSTAYGVYRLRPECNASYEYFNLALRSGAYDWEFQTRSKGIWKSRLQLTDWSFLDMPLIIPPLREQVAIARYLDYVDVRVRRLTEAKRKLIGLLTEYKQAIIHRAVTRGLDPNAPLKDSGIEWLGMVPQHWEVRRFKTEVANIIDQTDRRDEDDEYIALEHVESWTGKIYPAPPDMLFDSQVKKFEPGDVLFGKLRPYLAKVARPKRKGVCVSEFFVFRPRNGTLSAGYLEQFLRSSSVIGVINSSTFGAKMPRTDWKYIGNLSQLIPPLPEQVAIVEYLDRTTAEIDIAVARAERQIELLNEYRTRLIADVVTGKLDVRDATLDPEEIDR